MVLKYFLIGAIGGYFIIHPSIMIIAHLMKESLLNRKHPIQESIILEIFKSFSLDMLPWGLMFSILSAIISLYYGKTRRSNEILKREITARKQREETFQKSNKFLSSIFNSFQDPFSVIDSNYRIVLVNEAYTEMRSKTVKELIGARCYKALHNRSSICEDCLVEKTLKSGHPFAKEKPITFPNGLEGWVETYTHPIIDEESVVSHVIEYTRDITEHKRAEEATKLARTELNQIFNTATDGMRVIDEGFNILRVNATLSDLSGIEERGVVGRKCYDVFNIPICHTPNCPLIRIIGGEKHVEEEIEKVRTDGTRITYIITATAFLRPDGKVIGIVENFKDISERKQMERKLEKLSITDNLTQVYNRTKFEEIIRREMEMVKRHNYPLSIVMFDIDQFKEVNDSYGHNVGDYVLKTISHIVKEDLREINYIARWGGEEFIIIAPHTDLEGAKVLAERLRKRVQYYKFDKVERVTLSFGVTQFGKGDTRDDFIKRADDALYKAKNNGRNRVEVF